MSGEQIVGTKPPTATGDPIGTQIVNAKLPVELHQRMKRLIAGATYQPTITSVVVRGVELACDEMERLQAQVAAPKGETA